MHLLMPTPHPMRYQNQCHVYAVKHNATFHQCNMVYVSVLMRSTSHRRRHGIGLSRQQHTFGFNKQLQLRQKKPETFQQFQLKHSFLNAQLVQPWHISMHFHSTEMLVWNKQLFTMVTKWAEHLLNLKNKRCTPDWVDINGNYMLIV